MDPTFSASGFKTNVTLPDHPKSTFEEVYFLYLLAGSISLSLDEKQKIIEAVSRLSQKQIDELINIFEEEKRKFAELEEKHGEQIQKLREQHASEWQLLETRYTQKSKAEEDNAKAEEIRKQLGL